MNRNDFSNKRFGRLVVLKDSGQRKHGKVLWECLCDCGNKKLVMSTQLKQSRVKSCGCLKLEGKKPEDISAIRFGKLVALRRTEERDQKAYKWLCKCDCGNRALVSISALKRGNTKSCGCLLKETAKHNGIKHADKVSGENSYRWNPNLTKEERKKGRNLYSRDIHRWRRSVFERDSFECVVCRKKSKKDFPLKLNAHHLDGWNKHKRKRMDIDNGVTLCEDCHKEFHSTYGYGDNTKGQFEEHIKQLNL